MINGVRTALYPDDAEATRAFLRDVRADDHGQATSLDLVPAFS